MGPRGRFYPYLYILHILDCLGQDMRVLYLGRAPRTKETLPNFLKWRRVTRSLLVFRGLTGSQRTPGFWGVTKSTSGYVFALGGAAVSWKCSKQTCIARSTMESEFIALDKTGEEAEWLRNFLEDIPMWTKPVSAICIHCDSEATIGRA